jgi:hypothetical protein
LIIGFALLLLSFLLLPILIGLLIMPIGVAVFLIGITLSFWEMIPGHELLEPKLDKFWKQYLESSPLLRMIFKKNKVKTN